MTTIGILGSGRVGGALAAKFTAAGHDVIVGPDHARTAREASVVVNATPGDTTLARLAVLKSELDGKILVDVANATGRGADGLPGQLCYPDSSLAEQLQQALPGTQVVKTLNTMLFTVMTDPRSLGTAPTAFLSGNDEEAKKSVGALLVDLGWLPEWIEDLGGIETARGTEALVLLVPHLLRRHGFQPFALTIARSTS